MYQAVHRWADSMPQYEVGHDQLIAEIENNFINPSAGLHLNWCLFAGSGPAGLRR
jgi:protoporphyrinogen oxidase